MEGAVPEDEHPAGALPVLHRCGGGGYPADRRQPDLEVFLGQRADGGREQPAGAGPGQYEPGQLPAADDAHRRYGILPGYQGHGPGGGQPHRAAEPAV